MGVFGLTSYISENASVYLMDHKLHDGVVIIDGNAAASLIYSKLTRSNHAFGGDYDRYAHSTTEFVHLFTKCNVHPVFIFDGGYETRKLQTVIERMKLNVIICGQYKNKYRESRSFPLLLRDVFKMILHELGVLVIQCDFEADHEIVTLAKLMNCPVISNDSDFYISDTQYIPFNTIDLRAVRFKKKTSKHKYYIPCKKFCTDEFLNRLGGLQDRSLLPLLSCALGNDYIPQKTFKNFLDLSHIVKFDGRIRKIVKWLRTVTSVDEAVEQMVAALGRNRRDVRNKMKQLIYEHNRNSSELLSYIPTELTLNATLVNNLSITSPLRSGADNSNAIDDASTTIPNDINVADCDNSDSIDLSVVNTSVLDPNVSMNDENIDESAEEDDVIVLDIEEFDIPDSTSESGNETGETATESDINNASLAENLTPITSENFDVPVNDHCHGILLDFEIPSWLVQKYRIGLISPTIMNMLNFQRIFIPSQSEDYFSRPSHEICLPVLQFVVGIVLSDESATTRVQCYARIKNMQIGVFHIEPIFEIPSIGRLPTLGSVLRWDLETRIAVLLDCLNIPRTTELNLFPEEWRLYIITLMYWKKNCQQSMVNESHLRALFVCLIYLSVIDRKIGFARCASDLKQLRKKKKITECESEPAQTDVPENANVECCISLISEADCFKAADALLHYHQMDANLLKDRKQFNVKLVHAFAQLQHCIQSIALLNSVLNFPFVQYQPCLVFSGTFLYNFHLELHSRKLADGYITRTLLAKANTVISLYRYLMVSWNTCIATKKEQLEVKKKKSRKRKSRYGHASQAEQIDECDEEYNDPDNIFSMLPME